MTHTMTERGALSRLVASVNQEGASFRQMSDRARARGHEISHAQLADFARGRVRNTPKRPVLEALAAALGLPFEQVRAAALEQFMDYVPQQMNEPGQRITYPAPADLTSQERAQIEAMIRAFLESRR